MKDSLNREERVRLEALNQSVHSLYTQDTSSEVLLKRARMFENYILGGKAIPAPVYRESKN